jgi:hypothetical protein
MGARTVHIMELLVLCTQTRLFGVRGRTVCDWAKWFEVISRRSDHIWRNLDGICVGVCWVGRSGKIRRTVCDVSRQSGIRG